MNLMDQIRLMEKLSPSADEIIKHYNEGIEEFSPTNKGMFDEHSDTIIEMVGGIGIIVEYTDGKVIIK